MSTSTTSTTVAQLINEAHFSAAREGTTAQLQACLAFAAAGAAELPDYRHWARSTPPSMTKDLDARAWVSAFPCLEGTRLRIIVTLDDGRGGQDHGVVEAAPHEPLAEVFERIRRVAAALEADWAVARDCITASN